VQENVENHGEVRIGGKRRRHENAEPKRNVRKTDKHDVERVTNRNSTGRGRRKIQMRKSEGTEVVRGVAKRKRSPEEAATKTSA
jgi:hypothetical protein